MSLPRSLLAPVLLACLAPAVAAAQTGSPRPAGGTADPDPPPAAGPSGGPASPPAPEGPAGGSADPAPAPAAAPGPGPLLIAPAPPPPRVPAPPHERPVEGEEREGRVWASLAEGLSARSGDGAFSIRIGALNQFRFEAGQSRDETRDASFVMRMVRPQVRGNVAVPWVRYFIQPELAGANARLLDLELEARPHEAIGLRVGQFLTPFSRAFFTPVPRLQFPDFSVANDAFRADRDTGAMLLGTPFAARLEYYLGVFNGNGIDKGGNDDRRMLWVARLVASPLGRVDYDETPTLARSRPLRVALGANVYRGEVARAADPATTPPTPAGTDTSTTGGVDLAAFWQRVSLQAELYWRQGDNRGGPYRSLGGYAQAGVMLLDRIVELGGRLSLVDPDRSQADDTVRVVEGLLTYYASGNNLKLQARYANGHVGRAGATSTSASASVVEAGQSVHSATLQVQLFF